MWIHRFAMGIALALLTCIAAPSQADNHDDFPLAAPGVCTPDPVAEAIVDFMARQQSGRASVPGEGAEPGRIVAYDHAARSVTLSQRGQGREAVTFTLQDARDAAITVTVTNRDGRRTAAVLAPELGLAQILPPGGGGQGTTARIGRGGPFDTIALPGDSATDAGAVIRRLVLKTPPDDGICGGQTAICTAQFNRMMSFGFLCAISAGGDIDSCNGASDAKCAWCDCKGYNCRGC